MLSITPQMRILVAVDPVDFRRGIDGLGGLCRQVLRQDPFSGCAFVFLNRRSTAIKVLVYDGDGFWLCQKRLSRGSFQWWPQALDGQPQRELAARELQLMLWNGDPQKAALKPHWRAVRMELIFWKKKRTFPKSGWYGLVSWKRQSHFVAARSGPSKSSSFAI